MDIEINRRRPKQQIKITTSTKIQVEWDDHGPEETEEPLIPSQIHQASEALFGQAKSANPVAEFLRR